MSTRDSAQGPQTVLAVLVLHERSLEQATPWSMLRAWMHAGTSSGAPLSLAHVLIYDNSSRPRLPAQGLPAWARYVHDPANGGTAAAYAHALQEARRAHVAWVLLLDHDTRLPADFLDQAAAAMAQAGGRPAPAAWLPRVCQGGQPLSPARITPSGSIRPLAREAKPKADDVLTAIASGALVQARAFHDLGPVPPGLWLDYVDHWLFSGLQSRGHTLGVFDAVLQHELSLTHAGRLSKRRLISILRGEEIFTRTLAWPARRVRPLRLLWRALRPSRLRLSQRADIVGYVLRGMVTKQR